MIGSNHGSLSLFFFFVREIYQIWYCNIKIYTQALLFFLFLLHRYTINSTLFYFVFCFCFVGISVSAPGTARIRTRYQTNPNSSPLPASTSLCCSCVFGVHGADAYLRAISLARAQSHRSACPRPKSQKYPQPWYPRRHRGLSCMWYVGLTDLARLQDQPGGC